MLPEIGLAFVAVRSAPEKNNTILPECHILAHQSMTYLSLQSSVTFLIKRQMADSDYGVYIYNALNVKN
jgi:hypothetical protein